MNKGFVRVLEEEKAKAQEDQEDEEYEDAIDTDPSDDDDDYYSGDRPHRSHSHTPDDDMAGERSAVAHHNTVTNMTVVSDVGVRQQCAIIADGRAGTFFRASMNANEFSDDVAIANFRVADRVGYILQIL